MKYFKEIYLNVLVKIINFPKFLFPNNDSFNLFRINLKNRIFTKGFIMLNDKKFIFETDSLKTYQRYIKILKKEPETIDWIDSFKPGDIFWDIGANVGVFSFYSSFRDVKTFSFEPDPLNYKEFLKMIVLNKVKNISPFLLGIGSSDLGYFDLEFDDDGLEAGRSMRSLNTTGTVKSNSFKTLTMSLKSLIFNLNIDYPNHIKIDVDGNELAILNNQEDFLSNPNIKSILIEIDITDDFLLNNVQKIMKASNFNFVSSIESKTGSKYINYIFKK